MLTEKLLSKLSIVELKPKPAKNAFCLQTDLELMFILIKKIFPQCAKGKHIPQNLQGVWSCFQASHWQKSDKLQIKLHQSAEVLNLRWFLSSRAWTLKGLCHPKYLKTRGHKSCWWLVQIIHSYCCGNNIVDSLSTEIKSWDISNTLPWF